MSKTYLSMLAVGVEGSPFIDWYSMSKTYLSMLAVGVFSNVEILAYFVQQIHNTFTQTYTKYHFTNVTIYIYIYELLL